MQKYNELKAKERIFTYDLDHGRGWRHLGLPGPSHDLTERRGLGKGTKYWGAWWKEKTGKIRQRNGVTVR